MWCTVHITIILYIMYYVVVDWIISQVPRVGGDYDKGDDRK